MTSCQLGFQILCGGFFWPPPLICEAEPLRPDLRRFNKKGLFGIILKEPTASRSENQRLSSTPHLRFLGTMSMSTLYRGEAVLLAGSIPTSPFPFPTRALARSRGRPSRAILPAPDGWQGKDTGTCFDAAGLAQLMRGADKTRR
jgi:hypothetical protein